MVTVVGDSVEDTATYACDDGFEVVGDSVTMCTQIDTDSAAFSPAPPICRRKFMHEL